MNIDFATFFNVVLAIAGIGVLTSIILAFRSINTGKKLQFYKKRQDLIVQGWRLFLLAFILVVTGFVIYRFGEPVAYKYFPPSPTITRTPTITITPTITLTPEKTLTPTITLTLAQTYTPFLPDMMQKTIQTPVGVDTKAVFSVIQFSTQTKGGVVINTVSSFTPPVTQLFGGFSYDKMALGVQWTAIWLRGTEIVCAETKIWTYAPGGYGYTDCTKPASEWLPGEYEVQIFVGQTWKNSGRFTIKNTSVAATPSVTLTPKINTQPTATPIK